MLFLLISLLGVTLSERCSVEYKCIESDRTQNGMCMVKGDEETEGKTMYYVTSCQKNQYCPLSSKISADVLYCESNRPILYPGDVCIFNNQCRSKLCVNNICSGKSENETCTYHYDCNKDLYCESSICKKVKSEGDACTSDVQCDFGTMCSTYNKTKQCLRLYSLPVGAQVDTNLVCSSGFMNNKKMCIEKIYNKSNGGSCKDESDCLYTDSDGTQSYGTCACNKEGKQYCSVLSSSSEWKNFIGTLNDVYEKYHNGNIEKIHTAVFGREAIYKIKEINLAFQRTKSEYIKLSSCVFDAFFGSGKFLGVALMNLLVLVCVL